MLFIPGLEARPFQRWRTTIEEGSVVKFRLKYFPSIQMWFIDIEYKEKSFKGIRLTRNVNILNQFCNIIPFGLRCETNQSYEPFLINDFSTEKFRLNILNQAELNEIEAARTAAKV